MCISLSFMAQTPDERAGEVQVDVWVMSAPRKQGGPVHPRPPSPWKWSASCTGKLLNASDSGSLGVRWEGSDVHHVVVEPEDVSISRAARSVGTLAQSSLLE